MEGKILYNLAFLRDYKDWNDSGSEPDEKPNTSAPKNKKTAACYHNAVLKN
jgi:hypothetical protein